MKYLTRNHFIGLAFLSLTILLAGCSIPIPGAQSVGAAQVPGGDPERGQELLRDYGCYTCHVIPGVPGAHTQTGPPLSDWANRIFVAGQVVNTPDNLIQWIMDPQSIEPDTAMPNLDVTEEDARHISAYLYMLRN